jgi:hypothetical protein
MNFAIRGLSWHVKAIYSMEAVSRENLSWIGTKQGYFARLLFAR